MNNKTMKIVNCISLLIIALLCSLAACKKDKVAEETVTDVDGNVYHTLKIGTQTWMLENLRVTKLNDGVTPISNLSNPDDWKNTNSAAYCWYENNDVDKEKFGALYNGFAVKTGKLAPEGWHVATEADWNTLLDYLITNGYNYDNSTSGNKVAKSLAAKSGWQIDNTEGNVGNNQSTNNKSGFTVQPAGIRSFNGLFIGKGGGEHYWFSNVDLLTNAANIIYADPSLYFSGYGPTHGLSVRCVKDPVPVP